MDVSPLREGVIREAVDIARVDISKWVNMPLPNGRIVGTYLCITMSDAGTVITWPLISRYHIQIIFLGVGELKIAVSAIVKLVCVTMRTFDNRCSNFVRLVVMSEE